MTVEEADLPGISVDFVEGMHVENGFVSPYMVRDPARMETVFEDPYILMTNKPISNVQDLMPALDQVMKDPRPLVILAEKVDGSALGHARRQQPAPDDPGGRRARARASATGASSTSATSRPSRAAQVIAEEAGLTLDHVRPRVLRHARGA